MRYELSAKQSAITASLVAVLALIFTFYKTYTTLLYLENSIPVPAQIVEKSSWHSARIKFKKFKEHEVVDWAFGLSLPLKAERDIVTIRLPQSNNSKDLLQLDDFLTTWIAVIVAGWLTLSFGYIAIGNFYFGEDPAPDNETTPSRS